MFDVKRKPNTTSHALASTAGAAQGTARSAETMSDHLLHQTPGSRPASSRPIITPPTLEARNCQTKLPVITGEAQYCGTLRLDGTVTGQMAASGGSLSVRQRSKSFFKEPEFSGEVSFRDMVRVNGHIAGTVYSQKGTLIVDVSAIVAGNVEVGVAIINGTVNGDIVAHERVEIGPSAKIHGNIWTRSIEIKNGAIFEGLCTMLAAEQIAG